VLGTPQSVPPVESPVCSAFIAPKLTRRARSRWTAREAS
jgi:hypothetical protein